MTRLTAREALSYGMFGSTTILQHALSGNGGGTSAFRSLDTATRQLRDAIATRIVTAEGYPEKFGQPSLSTETLPWILFENYKNLAVDHTGEVIFLPPAAPEFRPLWKNVAFDVKEIKTLWPVTNQQVNAWMDADFANFPLKKRKDRIEDCADNNNCTHAIATASFNRSPAKKRGRGQRATNILE